MMLNTDPKELKKKKKKKSGWGCGALKKINALIYWDIHLLDVVKCVKCTKMSATRL